MPSKSHRTLVSNYNKTKEKANGHMTFDETVIRMELSFCADKDSWRSIGKGNQRI